MMLLLHITVAFVGLGFTAYTYMAPSVTKLYTAVALALTTLLSGTYLLIASPSHLVPACLMGLTYFGLVTIGIVASRRKLQLAPIVANTNKRR